MYLDDGETPHSAELGGYSLVKLSSSMEGGGLRGNASALVRRRGYDPQVDPLLRSPLVVEELAITGLDAHALQGRSISGTVNGKPLPPFSLYFDPFTSVLRVLFGDKARAHEVPCCTQHI